jgi:hypothetical protein
VGIFGNPKPQPLPQRTNSHLSNTHRYQLTDASCIVLQSVSSSPSSRLSECSAPETPPCRILRPKYLLPLWHTSWATATPAPSTTHNWRRALVALRHVMTATLSTST